MLITSITWNPQKLNSKNSNSSRHSILQIKSCGGHFRFSPTILFVLKMDLCYRLTTKLFFSVADHIKLTRTAYISLLCALFLFIATDSICEKNVQIDLFPFWWKTISFNLNLTAEHIFSSNGMETNWKMKKILHIF